jgi:serine/threonine-protein kinase
MAGKVPKIEDYVDARDGREISVFLRELIPIDLAYRRGRGERPDPHSYLTRFPGHKPLIIELLGEAAAPPAVGESDRVPLGSTVDAPATRTRLTLSVTDGPHAGRTFTLDGHECFVVGRGKCAHFKLPLKDKYFSRFHFMIEFNPPFCRLLDLGSTNHTFVNGKRAMKADLETGDIITGGKTVIRVLIGEVPDEEEAVAAETSPGPEGRTVAPALAPSDGLDLDLLTVDVPATGADLPPPGSSPRVCVYCRGDAADTPAATPAARAARAPLCTACREKLHARAQPIEGYALLRELGRGGMGVVYQAVRLSDDALVALKTIHRSGTATVRDIARFLREAKILRELDHPRITRFLDVGEARGRLYLVMEYVPGSDASELLKRTVAPMATPRAVGLVCQALEAMEYAHARGFVHRDVKPSNLLVAGPPGQEAVKLADFGLARIYEASRLSGLTISSDLAGTTAFLAPEQIVNYRETRPAADLYATGATLYYLLTRCLVYDFPDRLELKVLKILQDDPVPVRRRRPELPDGLVAVIDRALSREPEARFPDARSMREALEACL